jgi:hypothetical protein
MSIHLVVYSNNEPFNTTKRLNIESIKLYTSRTVVIHDYNLDSIKEKSWFTNIEGLPSIHKDGRRDGYYNSLKAYITEEVYESMDENDILYYVDSSQWYRNGFTENIDKLCDICEKIYCIAGSVGPDSRNISGECCDKLHIWNKIMPTDSSYLYKFHVLNSWFLFKKCKENDLFIKEWSHYTSYTDQECTDPLVTYHHTGDQSIFNILVNKHNMPVFFSKDIPHFENKDKNRALSTINNSLKVEDYFIVL